MSGVDDSRGGARLVCTYCGTRGHLNTPCPDLQAVLEPCDAQYGKNPDLCHQPTGHAGTHSNRYGCTWADQ